MIWCYSHFGKPSCDHSINPSCEKSCVSQARFATTLLASASHHRESQPSNHALLALHLSCASAQSSSSQRDKWLVGETYWRKERWIAYDLEIRQLVGLNCWRMLERQVNNCACTRFIPLHCELGSRVRWKLTLATFGHIVLHHPHRM